PRLTIKCSRLPIRLGSKWTVSCRQRLICGVRISVVPVPSVFLVQELQKMVRHKVVRSLVVAASLVGRCGLARCDGDHFNAACISLG
ncbi:MAG: hypothetical protein WCK86_22575, partial [Planctomycetia bacterium]